MGGKRVGAGRKPVRINLAEVEKLCSMQCTDQELAAWFHVSTRTIERRRKSPGFGAAVERGRAKGKTSLRRSLWGLALKGNPAANIFLAKNLLGYRDVVATEHSGPDGAPIALSVAPDLSELSDEELRQLRSITEKALPARRD